MRLIDANEVKEKIGNLDGFNVISRCIDEISTIDAVPKKQIAQATNKIIKCSLGKWYVGRVDGAPDEVVLLDDALRVMNELLQYKEGENG